MIDRTERLAQLLHDAILVAEASKERSVLRHLRGARSSLNDAEGANIPMRVDLLSGRVFARGFPVALSRAELAVVVALALNERGIPREALADDLYPAADPRGALDAVKMNIFRARRRVGSPELIRYNAGRYSLGDNVVVEFFRIEREVRRIRSGGTLNDESRDRLDRLRQRIVDGRPAFMLEWSWFDDTERRLRGLANEITIVLAHDALHQEHYQRATELAAELVREDPLDEIAVEIAIRACLLAGNRTAAVLEYRRYSTVLSHEINSHPSADLRALIAGG